MNKTMILNKIGKGANSQIVTPKVLMLPQNREFCDFRFLLQLSFKTFPITILSILIIVLDHMSKDL